MRCNCSSHEIFFLEILRCRSLLNAKLPVKNSNSTSMIFFNSCVENGWRSRTPCKSSHPPIHVHECKGVMCRQPFKHEVKQGKTRRTQIQHSTHDRPTKNKLRLHPCWDANLQISRAGGITCSRALAHTCYLYCWQRHPLPVRRLGELLGTGGTEWAGVTVSLTFESRSHCAH